MSRTLTLRLSDDDAAMVDQLQQVLEQRTASKALLAAARDHARLVHRVESLERRLELLSGDLQQRDQLLRDVERVYRSIRELTGQGALI